MIFKKILTIVLSLFVLTSLVVLGVKELKGITTSNDSSSDTQETKNQGQGEKQTSVQSTKVITYYFHGKVRCPTCRNIEANAKEAVDTGFAKDLKEGQLEWQTVNYDKSGNEHFAKDFQLAAPSVVLVMKRGDQQIGWKNLAEVWEHVDDKPAFIQYVQKNMREFLETAAKPIDCRQ